MPQNLELSLEGGLFDIDEKCTGFMIGQKLSAYVLYFSKLYTHYEGEWIGIMQHIGTWAT